MLTAAQRDLPVHIRWMVRRDMDEVKAIEFASFDCPWFEEDFIRALTQRNVIGMVAEGGQHEIGTDAWPPLQGFMVYELHQSRLHILNFAVATEARRLGVGRQMIEKLTSKLSTQRRTRITLEVRDSNLPAQLFFKAMGFQAVTVLRSYYSDCDEDAYLFQYKTTQEAVV